MTGITRTSPVVLISGGGTGVGAATALRFARRGWHVAINWRSSGDAARETVTACKELGVDAADWQGDMAQDADCRALVEAVQQRWGRIDALVCSAGTTQFARFDDLEAQNGDDFQRVFAVNVLGAYQLTRAAGPLLAQTSGAVVMVSSIAGQSGNGSSLAYVASKGALNAVTLALARVLAPQVRVNAVLPGLIDSGWFLNGMSDGDYANIRRNAAAAAALQTVCSPDDIAGAIEYLAVDATRMTGQLMVVDAGALLGGGAVKVSK